MNRYTLKAAHSLRSYYKPLTDAERCKLVALRYALAKGRARVTRMEKIA